jgi:hypothetical protein
MNGLSSEWYGLSAGMKACGPTLPRMMREESGCRF